ncbi:MAG TPA: squalene synthase HpnC [Lautropia sp.]|nr:squalene synthase HpnC [Lautropia sp.]
MSAPLDAPFAPPAPASAPSSPDESANDPVDVGCSAVDPLLVNRGPEAVAAGGHAWHGVEHYENFPVGSWLVPRRLRPAVLAIYRFARHADDIADEGDADAHLRNARLQALHRELESAERGLAAREPVVGGLTAHVLRHRLSWRYFHDLLDAFQQDLSVARYPDPEAIGDYCRRSADPVGRLMLELFDAATPANHSASDAICSALQRINFLQDIVIDFRKDRVYLPLSTLASCGLDPQQLGVEIESGGFSAATRRAVAIEASRARRQLLSGRSLLTRVPPRLAWELRFILAGGLQILDRLQAVDHDVAAGRPTIGWRDAPALLHKALTLSRRKEGSDDA